MYTRRHAEYSYNRFDYNANIYTSPIRQQAPDLFASPEAVILTPVNTFVINMQMSRQTIAARVIERYQEAVNITRLLI